MEINYSFMMEEFLKEKGIKPEDIREFEPEAAKAHKMIQERGFSELAFLDLPFQDTREIEDTGRWIREKAEYFLILGIGGSALGPRVLLDTFKKTHRPNVFIYDNVDPGTLDRILRHIKLKDTVINVITKSGTTGETVASFMILWDSLKKEGLRPEEHIVITTDPEKGPMRRIAKEYALRSLSIPSGVVGRYSVLSPVGLLLASVLGVKPQELLEGARQVHKRCTVAELKENPAYMFGSLLHLMDKKFSRRINILMPYSDALKSFSEWFCQLWAESLGKNGKGLMPYPSVGAVDQHSQLQLWIEGPDDKVVIFIRIEDYGVDYKIPEIFPDIKEFAFLGGHTLSKLIQAEQEATALSLMKAGRPNITISINTISPTTIGELFHFFEIATAFTGILYGINPFNQPAVEEGKLYTRAMMGSPDLEDRLREVMSVREKANYKIGYRP